jgi:hypothetical protein
VDGFTAPMTVQRHRAKINFGERDGKLLCTIDVRVKGRLNEFALGEAEHSESTLENMVRCYEETIAGEINRAFFAFQREYAVDGYNWLALLRKKQYTLYQRYAEDDWERVFAEMEMRPNVRVEIL